MDTIHIEGLEIFAKHGVYPEENVLGQKFIVNADFFLDARGAGLSDDLGASVDYGALAVFINRTLTENTWKLIEAAAENLAAAILQKYHMIRELRLEIKKPWAPIGLPVEYASVIIERKWHTAYLSIGSNMGDRQGYLDLAAEELDRDPNCFLSKIADTIETAPYGVTKQPDFLNSCMEIRTLYTPKELLAVCNEIERQAGRERTVRWGPRTLDMDILLYDDCIMSEEALIIPHIEMHKRAFVLRPLAQIAPYVVHPILKKRVVELLGEIE